MARGRSGSSKKRPRAQAKAKAKPLAKPRAKTSKPRRRRAARVKKRLGPVQLWLPLQMPLGLLGGVAVAPEPPPRVLEDAAPASEPVSADQSSLFD